jgi:ABC-type dipeptide/oligopeptide/nickel transport system permease subunit
MGYTETRLLLSRALSPLVVLAGRMRKDRMASLGAAIVVVLSLIAIFGPLLSPYDPLLFDLDAHLCPPDFAHPFGCDWQGRDILSRIISGTRLALGGSAYCVALGASIGAILGLVAGYLGGTLDIVIMRTTDALLSFPYLLLVILVVAMIGPSFENSIISIAIWSIPNYVRLVRSTTLTIKEREFIQAAKVTGESSLAIMFYHILPGCVSVIVVQSTIFLGRAIEIMAALSFLGLGAQPPMPEWGAMVGLGRLYIQSAPYVVVFPALAIFVAILGFNALGDALRDALDPRLRGVL